MPTMKKRINVTVNKDLERGISILAKRRQMSKSAVLAELAKEALELQEDLDWARIVEERMKKKVKFIPNSDAIWK